MAAVSSEVISTFQTKRKRERGGRGRSRVANRRQRGMPVFLPLHQEIQYCLSRAAHQTSTFNSLVRTVTRHVPSSHKVARQSRVVGDTGPASPQCLPWLSCTVVCESGHCLCTHVQRERHMNWAEFLSSFRS